MSAERWRKQLVAASILLLLPVCLLTGGSQSPLRFAYYPLVVFLTLLSGVRQVLRAGFAFSIGFVLLVIFDHPPLPLLQDLTAEAISFFAVTIAAGLAVKTLEDERRRAENISATFHSISDALNQETTSLQATLDALSTANRQLQETDLARVRFLGNISHELRAPLCSIRSYSEILLEYTDIDPSTAREFLQVINQESERMSGLVNQTLEMVRIDSGRVELNVASIAPVELLDESIRVVAPMARAKRLPLRLDAEPGLALISGDRERLVQVLVNLLSNAVKFTAEGSITAGCRRIEEGAEFFVADTGEGIFPEERETIFEEYYRVADNPTRAGGSGLGLTIARKIVEYHGGRIWVESTPGKGSTFHFTVPGEPAAATRQQEIPSPTGAPRAYGPVLVVSESTIVRQSLRKRLELLGYLTIGAATVRDGVGLALRLKPGVVVLDTLERGDDFLELEKWARNAGVELMLTTLYVNRASGELAVASHGYLSSPLDRGEVVAAVDPFRRNRGRFLVVSNVRDEARHVQAILGAERIAADVFVEADEAIRSAETVPATGVIIGSFPRDRLEPIVERLKGTQEFRDVPFFLIEGGRRRTYARPLTLEPPGNGAGGEGISLLIREVERAYAGMGDGKGPSEDRPWKES